MLHEVSATLIKCSLVSVSPGNNTICELVILLKTTHNPLMNQSCLVFYKISKILYELGKDGHHWCMVSLWRPWHVTTCINRAKAYHTQKKKKKNIAKKKY
jgi:hypothetical protein